MTDPCSSVDPFVEDILGMMVWLPRESVTDTIECLPSVAIGAGCKQQGISESGDVPKCVIIFICCDASLGFVAVGVN
jgi:hypothetical protein